MARGFPSMTALLGLLAVAGYQNREKLAEILGGGGAASKGLGSASEGVASIGQRASEQGGGGGLLGGLGGLLSGSTAGGLLGGGLSELVDRFQQSGHGKKAESWVRQGPMNKLRRNSLNKRSGLTRSMT